ncbi:MAG: paraquat-inducible protein A [Pusillimonas sp.]|nr:paraquat-inducible protein A [Pusillimonas sp.]
MASPPLVICPHCARLHERTPIAPGAIASCVQCGYELYRHSRVSLEGWLALCWTSLFVFAVANLFPVAHISLSGKTANASFPHALYLTWLSGDYAVALMAGLFVFAFPLGQIMFLMWAIQAVRKRRLPWDFRFGLRMLEVLSHWSMVPVLFLAMLVSMVKMADLARLAPAMGLWAFGVLAFMLTALSRVSAHRLWHEAEDAALVALSGQALATNHIAGCTACGYVQDMPRNEAGKSCDRCSAYFHLRKPKSNSRAWAFLAAASILYFPANLYPVMTMRMPIGTESHTILGGVIELWHLGSWDLALIVFIASVVVPLTKILVLAALMTWQRWQGPMMQRQRTRLYEMVELVGQWSMLDVFVVIFLSSMADFPGLVQIIPGLGAASFGLVVILTMFAAMSYDPRLGWDRARGQLGKGAQHGG